MGNPQGGWMTAQIVTRCRATVRLDDLVDYRVGSDPWRPDVVGVELVVGRANDALSRPSA